MLCPNCTCSSCLAGPAVLPESVTSTPPSHLKTTNHCLTNPEIDYLKEVIERAQGAFSIVDERFKQVKSLLDGLLEQRTQLLDTIEEHKVILSPLRRFPPEILGEIFMAYTEMEGTLAAPIFLAQLCSRWRSIALNMPRLWSRFNVKINANNFNDKKSILEAHMARSGQAPLNMTITYLGPGSGGMGTVFRDLLIPQAHRWEHINLDIPWALHLDLAPMLKGRLQSLKSITFPQYLNNYWSEKFKSIDCYFQAPKLTDVDIAGVCDIPLPWQQFRNWRLSTTMDNVHNMLHAAGELVNWAVVLYKSTNLSPLPPANFQHSHLTSLNVKFAYSCTPDQLGFFFSALTLPSLLRLYLDTKSINRAQLDELSQLAVVSFFQRSSPPLVTFHAFFHPVPHSDDFLISCLECVPSLVDFKLDIACQNKVMVTDKFMRRLNTKYRGFILPKLEKLSLNGYLRFTSKAIAGMVASRRRVATAQAHSATTLQQLSLDLNRIHKSSPQEALQPFISGGLRIECKVSGKRD